MMTDQSDPTVCHICLEYFNTCDRYPITCVCGQSFCSSCVTGTLEAERVNTKTKLKKFSCPFCNERCLHIDKLPKPHIGFLETIPLYRKCIQVSKLCGFKGDPNGFFHKIKSVMFDTMNDFSNVMSDSTVQENLIHKALMENFDAETCFREYEVSRAITEQLSLDIQEREQAIKKALRKQEEIEANKRYEAIQQALEKQSEEDKKMREYAVEEAIALQKLKSIKSRQRLISRALAKAAREEDEEIQRLALETVQRHQVHTQTQQGFKGVTEGGSLMMDCNLKEQSDDDVDGDEKDDGNDPVLDDSSSSSSSSSSPAQKLAKRSKITVEEACEYTFLKTPTPTSNTVYAQRGVPKWYLTPGSQDKVIDNFEPDRSEEEDKEKEEHEEDDDETDKQSSDGEEPSSTLHRQHFESVIADEESTQPPYLKRGLPVVGSSSEDESSSSSDESSEDEFDSDDLEEMINKPREIKVPAKTSTSNARKMPSSKQTDSSIRQTEELDYTSSRITQLPASTTQPKKPKAMTEEQLPTTQPKKPKAMTEEQLPASTTQPKKPKAMTEEQLPASTTLSKKPKPMTEEQLPTTQPKKPKPMTEEQLPASTTLSKKPKAMTEEQLPASTTQSTTPMKSIQSSEEESDQDYDNFKFVGVVRKVKYGNIWYRQQHDKNMLYPTAFEAALCFDQDQRERGLYPSRKLNFPENSICSHCHSVTASPDAIVNDFLTSSSFQSSFLSSSSSSSSCLSPKSIRSQLKKFKERYGLLKSHETVLICDNCDGEFHLSCAGLTEVPSGDWYCPAANCSGLQRLLSETTPTLALETKSTSHMKQLKMSNSIGKRQSKEQIYEDDDFLDAERFITSPTSNRTMLKKSKSSIMKRSVSQPEGSMPKPSSTKRSVSQPEGSMPKPSSTKPSVSQPEGSMPKPSSTKPSVSQLEGSMPKPSQPDVRSQNDHPWSTGAERQKRLRKVDDLDDNVTKNKYEPSIPRIQKKTKIIRPQNSEASSSSSESTLSAIRSSSSSSTSSYAQHGKEREFRNALTKLEEYLHFQMKHRKDNGEIINFGIDENAKGDLNMDEALGSIAWFCDEIKFCSTELYTRAVAVVSQFCEDQYINKFWHMGNDGNQYLKVNYSGDKLLTFIPSIYSMSSHHVKTAMNIICKRSQLYHGIKNNDFMRVLGPDLSLKRPSERIHSNSSPLLKMDKNDDDVKYTRWSIQSTYCGYRLMVSVLMTHPSRNPNEVLYDAATLFKNHLVKYCNNLVIFECSESDQSLKMPLTLVRGATWFQLVSIPYIFWGEFTALRDALGISKTLANTAEPFVSFQQKIKQEFIPAPFAINAREAFPRMKTR